MQRSPCSTLLVCVACLLSVAAQNPPAQHPPAQHPPAQHPPAQHPPAPKPAAPKPAAPAPPSQADAEAIAAVVQGYFTALNARDLDAALRLWSEQSPEAAQIRQTMPMLFERRDPLWSEVDVTVLSVDGPKARARLTFKVTLRRPPQTTSFPPPTTRDVVELTRVTTPAGASEWRIVAEKPESQDAAERLIAAPDDAAVTRILTDEPHLTTLNVVRALLGVAAYAAAQQKWITAAVGYERAIRLAETPVVPLTDNERQMAEMHLATALGGLAQVLLARPQPDLPRAIELLNRALDISERVNSEVGVINTLQALGNAFYSAGDYAEALDRYQRVLPVAAKQQDSDAIARTSLGIGNVQYLFGQYDLARAAYTTSVEIYDAARDMDALPRALQGRARVLAATGDFDAARAEFQRALDLLMRTIQKSDQAAVMCDLGRIDFQQGRLADARTQFQQALTLAESIGDQLNIGRSQYSLGLVHVIERDFDGAIDRYTRAADALQAMAPPNVDAAGQAVLARASARFEQRDWPRALDDFTMCLGMFEKARNREGVARAHLGVAMVHRRRNQTKLALDAAARAFDFGERAAAPDVRWQARYEAGQGWLLAGDPAKARQAFEQAIRILEETRFEGGAEAEAQSPSQRAAPYVALVEWHIARGDAPAALVAADAAKRRMIEDLLRPFNFRLTRGLSAERQAEERRLVNQRVTLLRQIRRERDLMRPNAARIAKLEESLAAARVKNVEWNDALARDLPALAYQRGSAALTPASLDPLAAALGADAALLHFAVGDERTSVIVATRAAPSAAVVAEKAKASIASEPPGATRMDSAGTPSAAAKTTAAAGGNEAPAATAAGARADTASAPPSATTLASAGASAGGLDVFAFTVPVTRAQLADQVWRFTEGIAKRADTVTADGRALYELLLAPARERLAGRSTLVIVPDDALWTLPFEALMPTDDRYLIQDATITAMPSAATWIAQPAGQRASTPTSTGGALSARPSEVGAAALSAGTTQQPVADTNMRAAVGVFAAWTATGEFSDTSPLQTRLTFASGELPPLRADAAQPAATLAPLPEGAVPPMGPMPPSAATTPPGGATSVATAPTAATAVAPTISPATGATPAPAGTATTAVGASAVTPSMQSARPAAAGESVTSGSATGSSGTTLAAWELFDRDAGADEILLAEVRPKAERLRLDAGRLGATGLYWALQGAGARRVVLARRPLPTDARVTNSAPLPHPYEWAMWLVMGPPQPAPTLPTSVSQPPLAARLP